MRVCVCVLVLPVSTSFSPPHVFVFLFMSTVHSHYHRNCLQDWPHHLFSFPSPSNLKSRASGLVSLNEKRQKLEKKSQEKNCHRKILLFDLITNYRPRLYYGKKTDHFLNKCWDEQRTFLRIFLSYFQTPYPT